MGGQSGGHRSRHTPKSLVTIFKLGENIMAAQSGVVAEACNKFALDLHKFLGDGASAAAENLFCSPASLLVALAMTSSGAKGKTAEEIMKVLYLASVHVPTPDLNNNMKQFISTLNAASDNNTRLLTANKLFIEKSFEILESSVLRRGSCSG